MTSAIAAAEPQYPHGYSGWLGVLISGTQPGSASVSELPSASALRIAVIGRQT